MGKLKGHEIDAWLARQPPPTPIVLIYGTDRGLVSERARLYAQKSGVALDDPFSVVRLEASDIEKQRGLLVDEANTMPMFAGRRLIWVRNGMGQKALADDVKVLCADPPADTQILIEAGDLKKGVGLRATVEASPAALALPCYPDDERTIDAVIDQELSGTGLTIDPDARTLLKRGLGGDRIATRSELEKLVLSSHGRTSIDIAEVRALSTDSAAMSADDVVDAVLAGDLIAMDGLFANQVRNASQTFAVLSALQRQFQGLLTLRLGMERDGRSASSAVATARPPIFFSRQRRIETALASWRSGDIAVLLGTLQSTILETRHRTELAVSITHQALISIALQARRALKK